MKELKNIKFWLFDLDNTLYSGATKVFEQVDKKMTNYISTKLKISKEEAKKIQKNYFVEYNTTLNGMIKNHKIDANEFLEFVHDIDLSFLKEDRQLDEQIEKIEGIELIRAIENNLNLGTFIINGSSFAVDVNQDLMRAIDVMPRDRVRKLY